MTEQLLPDQPWNLGRLAAARVGGRQLLHENASDALPLALPDRDRGARPQAASPDNAAAESPGLLVVYTTG